MFADEVQFYGDDESSSDDLLMYAKDAKGLGEVEPRCCRWKNLRASCIIAGSKENVAD
jgi:hypothetical protein